MMIDTNLNLLDWEVRKFLKLVLIFQFAVICLVGLALLGIDIPVLRQLVVLIYLTLMPGLIILRILKPHNLDPVRTLLYAVGLSLAFDMFLGFLINILLPPLGIAEPISALPLLIGWTVVVSLFCAIIYWRERRGKVISPSSASNIQRSFSPAILFLILLPLLAVAGAEAVNVFQNNIVLDVLICLIALVPILAIFTKFISVRLYPLAIYSSALAILWHFSLISNYLSQYDLFLEYHYFSLVASSGHWDWTIAHNYNAMLAITVLPATIFKLSGISGADIFKIIYPLWYALVPVGLYTIYGKLLNSKQALLAAFFFISVQVFFLIIPSVARQMVGELFCVLLILLIVDGRVTFSSKMLFIIFGAALVVSHYSLSYIYIAFFVISLILLYVLRVKSPQVTMYTVILFLVICLAWYMYTSGASLYEAVANLVKDIAGSFSIEFLNPFSRDLASILLRPTRDALHFTNKLLWYLMFLFIFVGAFTLINDLRRRSRNMQYSILAICNYALLGICIVIPFFSDALGSSRMFHISSIVLAPYCILGAETIWAGLSRVPWLFKRLDLRADGKIPVTAALVLFFLFSTTLPFEIANTEVGRSFPLDFEHIRSGSNTVDLEDAIQVWSASPTDQEVSSAKWLTGFRNKELPVYGTYWQLGVPALVSYGMISPKQTNDLTPLTTRIDIADSYIYLGYINVALGYGTTTTIEGQPDKLLGNITHWNISQITPLLDDSSRIYTNGASEIYWSP